MYKSIPDVTAKIIRQQLADRHGYPIGRSRCLCTDKSYLRDKKLLAYLDSKPLSMNSEVARVLKDLRQAYKWSYKLRRPCSELQNEEAILGFRARNERATRWRLPVAVDGAGWPESRLSRVFILAQQLARSAVSGYAIGQPNHGPGTSYYRFDTRIEKYRWLERDAPYWASKRFPEFFKPSPASETIEPYQPGRNICRLACVPKDARGPRLVAPHMASAVWLQQAVMSGLGEILRTHPLFRSEWPGSGEQQCVQLEDQSVNQRLAKYASENPQMYATLDLKDASDLVSWRLVCFLFRGTRLLRDLWAVRASHVNIDGVPYRLGMHAPMGSATCFPIMGITLWALSTAVSWLMDHEWCKYRPRSRELWSVNKPFVFGDDIIVRTPHYNATKTVLELAGLALNPDKCFFGDGGFRESCGHDYYRGFMITPTLLRRDDIDTVEGFASLMTLVNRAAVEDGSLENSDIGLAVLRFLVDANKHRARKDSWLAFSADKYTPTIHVDTPVVAHRLNLLCGGIVRRNLALQRLEVRLKHLAPLLRQLDRRCEDSRARLYEALAVGLSQDSSITRTSVHQKFGWASDRSRTVTSWLSIQS